jgi:hypothetical protein
MKILNMPGVLRGALGTMLFMALFPPHIKNYNAMMRPIVDMFVDLEPRGRGIAVDDKVIHVALAWILNDTRGVPSCCNGKQAPCLCGSCVKCYVQGQSHHTSVVLPGAVRTLPIPHDLRDKYAEEFAAYEPLAVLATLPRSGKRTHKGIIKSGERVLAGADQKTEAFKGVTEFARLWYHNIAKHTIYDLAHALANMVSDTVQYVMVRTRQHNLTIPLSGRYDPIFRTHNCPTLRTFLCPKIGIAFYQ